jgi:hypothetical protein
VCITHVGPVVGGVLPEEEKGEQGFSVVHKPQVVRGLTRRLSKISLSTYRSYRVINLTCFTYFYMCYLCTMYSVMYDDDRFHGSTLPYVIIMVKVFIFINEMCYA